MGQVFPREDPVLESDAADQTLIGGHARQGAEVDLVHAEPVVLQNMLFVKADCRTPSIPSLGGGFP